MTTTINASALTEYDFVVVLDASGSMGETDMPGGKSRWNYMQENVLSFTRDVAKIDEDGIGLVLFGGSSVQGYDGCSPDRVKEIFASREPRGGTPLAEALTEALKLAGKSDKKDFILVFTDGEPNDKGAVINVITKAANSSPSDDALTILFVQVGRDAGATKFLQDLDDNLKGAKFDIVDTKTMDQAEGFASTADLIIAAIND